jgi:hypothetical protein
VVMVAAVLGWQYRNASYLLPLIPALVLLTAAWSPFTTPRFAPWMFVLIAAAFLVKASGPALPWGINAQEGTVQPAAPALSDYCEKGRGNPLIIVDFADDLYGSVLPLPRVRYASVVPVALAAGPYGMPFAEMGISVTVEQFNDLQRYRPVFEARLREWGLPNDAPLATLITARSREELAALVSAHPDTDFLVPAVWQGALASAPQEQAAGTQTHFFLLSRVAMTRASAPAWTCRM